MKKKVIFSIIFFILVAICINIPSFATFKITNFVIDSQLDEAGNLHVTEKISYYTNEYVNYLNRNIVTKNSRNTTNSADSLRLNYVKTDGEYCDQVNSATKGNNGVYECKKSYNGYNIKLYSTFIDEYKTVEYDYTLENVAVKYNDIGELFWNYIDDEWECLIENLTINITLSQSAANEAIYVFCQGEEHGTFTKTKNCITLKTKNILEYQPLDVRILFSRDAIGNGRKTVNKNILHKYINDEEGFSTKMDGIKVLANLDINELAIVLSLIIVVAGIVCYFVYDKEIKVEKVKYYREIPYGLQPEIVQYIYYDKIKSNSLYVAVLNLVKLGVYKLENIVNEVGKKTQIIVYNPKHNAKLKKYQQEMVQMINTCLDDNENGEKSIDLIRLEGRMANSKSINFDSYQSSLLIEKEALVGNDYRIPTNIKICVFFAFLVLMVIIAISIIKLGHGENAILITFLIGICTLLFSVFLLIFELAVSAFIVIIAPFIICQILIIEQMLSNNIVILYIPYILLFLLIQYILRAKKLPKEKRQFMEYVSGLRRYIKDYSMIKDIEAVEGIELWEDYFIMAIALELNNKTNYFYNYGTMRKSNLSDLMNNTKVYMKSDCNMYNIFYNYQKTYTLNGKNLKDKNK